MITKFSVKLLFLCLFMWIGNTGCTKSKQNPSEGFNIVASLDIIILDENNNDLLDPSKKFPKSINTSDISIARIIDGKEVVVNKPNSDAPKGYSIIAPEGAVFKNYRLNLGLTVPKPEDPVSKTIIKWTTDNKSELTAYYDGMTSNNIVYTKVLLDGKEVWSVQKPNNPEGLRYIIVHK